MRSIETLERTVWARAFKKDAPVSYAIALHYARDAQLEVLVERTDEAGEIQWAIRVLDDPAFWMDAKPTKKAAIALCRNMGWKVNVASSSPATRLQAAPA